MSVVLALTGPTASGKTEVACRLADRLPVSLISMDSAMVYRGMDIGTAKPPREVLARYPHALVDVRDPADSYSAADFVADADVLVRAAMAVGRLPVLVGGTMLYLRAFRDGLAALPPAAPEVRAAIVEQAERYGWPRLYRELERVDPGAAANIHPHNASRIQRALEVYRISGRPLSVWWEEQERSGATDRLGARLLEVALIPDDRAHLARAIGERFERMLEAGLVEEVAALRRRGDLSSELPSMRAVGYRQVWAYLDGAYDFATLRERGAAATRSLARRQLTWLRRWQHLVRLPTGEPAARAEDITALLELS